VLSVTLARHDFE